MKGSMILSLITLCVVMLFTADRISTHLHGPEPEPSAPALPQADIDWGGIWQVFTGLFNGREAKVSASADTDTGPVVISEDTLYRTWVWTGPDGGLRSASVDPGNDLARQVLIPKGMTPQEFFSPTAASEPVDSDEPPPPTAKEPPAGAGTADDPEQLAKMLADDRPMTREERQRFIREGMRLFREHQERLKTRE